MTEFVEVDPVLIAVSDLAVAIACQRAYNAMLGRDRWRISAEHRPSASAQVRDAEAKVDRALDSAWSYLPTLAVSHDITVPVGAWMQSLDGYTRAILLAGQPHNVLRLVPVLARLDRVPV